MGRIETVQDEMTVRMAGIEQAILHRVAASTKLDDNGRQYRGLSLIEMGRDFLEAHGQNTRGLDRMTLASRMLNFAGGPMGTSDFSTLFANVANKRLRSAYDENAGTYALWARRAPNAPDFKNMSVVQLAGAPDLLQTNEAGEFKYGAMTDGGETYAMLTYGRIVSLTRQAIVNDDLRASSAWCPPLASPPAAWKTAPFTASSPPMPTWQTAAHCLTPPQSPPQAAMPT